MISLSTKVYSRGFRPGEFGSLSAFPPQDTCPRASTSGGAESKRERKERKESKNKIERLSGVIRGRSLRRRRRCPPLRPPFLRSRQHSRRAPRSIAQSSWCCATELFISREGSHGTFGVGHPGREGAAAVASAFATSKKDCCRALRPLINSSDRVKPNYQSPHRSSAASTAGTT